MFLTSIHKTLWHPLSVLISNSVSTTHFMSSLPTSLTFISLLLFFFLSPPGLLSSVYLDISFIQHVEANVFLWYYTDRVRQCSTRSTAHPCVTTYSSVLLWYISFENIKSLYNSFHFSKFTVCFYLVITAMPKYCFLPVLFLYYCVSLYSFSLLFLSLLLCLLCWLN